MNPDDIQMYWDLLESDPKTQALHRLAETQKEDIE